MKFLYVYIMKPSIINLVLTVFLLWLTIQIKSVYEIYLAYFFILTVGIIHGANDISLINLITKESAKSKKVFLLFYLGLITLTSLVFFKVPFIALVIFIGFSCYHFGEQHFYTKLKEHNLKGSLLYISYGLLIFGLLFYLNSDDTTSIISELTGFVISSNYFLLFFLLGLIATLFFIYLNFKVLNDIDYFQEVFLLLLFALLFKLASLLWAFAIYFIIWHSLPSLKDQTLALYGNFNKQNFFKYVKSSSVNWIISIIGLCIVYYVSAFFQIRFITLFFAFLASITIPHVIVMYYLNKK